MKGPFVIGGCLVLAILLAGVVSAVTETAAIFGSTSIGIFIYLSVGIGLPQYLLYRSTEDPIQLGLAVLSSAGAGVSLLAGIALGGVNESWGFGIWSLLFVVVVGNLLGALVRSFRAGYRSTV